jgi:hypothetical protein
MMRKVILPLPIVDRQRAQAGLQCAALCRGLHFSGDPVRLMAGLHLPYPKAPVLERVRAFLQQVD